MEKTINSKMFEILKARAERAKNSPLIKMLKEAQEKKMNLNNKEE